MTARTKAVLSPSTGGEAANEKPPGHVALLSERFQLAGPARPWAIRAALALAVRGVLAGIVAIALAVPGGMAGAEGQLETFVAFDREVPELPEGVAVDKLGNVYVSLVDPVRQIRRIDPDGAQSVLVDFNELGVEGVGPAGLAVDARGTVYAAVIGVDLEELAVADPDLPDNHGVYRIGRDGNAEHLPGTEQILFPNDVKLDKQGNVYVTDTIEGAVWRIPRGAPGADPAELWIQHDLLAGDGRFEFLVPLGANGIAFRRNRIVVANTERGLLVEVPVEPDGSAGTPTVLAESPALVGVDGIAFDVHGAVYAATGVRHAVVRVGRDGLITTLATAEDGLNHPSTLAFGTRRGDLKTLFVANFSFLSRCCPAVLKLPVGQRGQPLP